MKMNISSPCLKQSLIIISLLVALPECCCNLDRFTQCNHHYQCGTIRGVWYPFWGENKPQWCGHQGFKLRCIGGLYNYIWMGEENQRFRVIDINQVNYSIRIARNDLWRDPCLGQCPFTNTTLDQSIFTYDSTVRNLSIFFGCLKLKVPEISKNCFTCTINGSKSHNCFIQEEHRDHMLTMCKENIIVPISQEAYHELFRVKINLRAAIRQGFQVIYKASGEDCIECSESGGICGSDGASQFVCHYFDTGNEFRGLKILIGIATAVIGILFSCLSIYSCRKMSKKVSWNNIQMIICKNKKKKHQNIEMLIRHGSFAPKRYRYSDIKKMTNSFKDKLGQGGYGRVYKGRLPDGCLVAVKILNTSNENGDEFINEVVNISRTSHVNIVSLLGFCFKGDKRALIYEFMANGSLEKFVHGGDTSQTQHLEWGILHQIAIGIARGLEYLHRGCNTKILHFDIKPHNILLDEEFHPKISDFGLAKLCSKKESIISIKDARGTIGYIAPEVASRSFGQVSHKSDVYSYGMMVLEMVGGRKNVDVGEGKTSKIYFPHWIYKRLEHGNDLGLQGDMNEEENEIAKKMVLAALWCIQTNPKDRPHITDAIDMLEGSLDALKMPPNIFMYSPSSSPIKCESKMITL